MKFEIMCELEGSPELFLQLTVGVSTPKDFPRLFCGSKVSQGPYKFPPQTYNGISTPETES